jgi:hypothetical protein
MKHFASEKYLKDLENTVKNGLSDLSEESRKLVQEVIDEVNEEFTKLYFIDLIKSQSLRRN